MPRVAYLVGRYPTITHTFVLREIAELRRRGLEVEPFSIWRAPPEQLLGERDRAEAKRTVSLLPPRLPDAFRSNAEAIRSAPSAYARMLVRAQRIAKPGLRGRLVALAWVFTAAMLWAKLRSRGIRHLHVHLNGTAPTVALLCSEFANRAARSEALTWSLTVHGPTEFFDVEGEALAEKVKAAAFVICISDFARSQLMTCADESQWPKLRVIHCGVDVRAAPDARPRSDNGSLGVLTIAGLDPRKGHAVLLEAVALARAAGLDVEVTIVGEGEKRAYLEAAARALGLAGHIRVLHPVSQDEIGALYAEADMFVIPSFAEGIPVSLMEAMLYRLPVVATAIMGVLVLVEDGINGLLVPPGRADELAAAIAALAESPERREALGTAARAKVEAEFDIAGTAAQVHELLADYV